MLRAPRVSIEESVESEQFFLPEEKVAAGSVCPAGTVRQLPCKYKEANFSRSINWRSWWNRYEFRKEVFGKNASSL
jgi:hypothetical protein